MKKQYVVTNRFKNDIIELMMTFCLFGKPPQEKPKGMEKLKFKCWKAACAKSMDDFGDLRKLYWSDIDMAKVAAYESDQELVRPSQEAIRPIRRG